MSNFFAYTVIKDNFPNIDNQVIRTAYLKGHMILLNCHQYNASAIARASDLVFKERDKDFYSFIKLKLNDTHINCISLIRPPNDFEKLTPYDLEKKAISKNITYISNFFAHRIYVILDKIDRLYNQRNFLDVVSKLSSFLNEIDNSKISPTTMSSFSDIHNSIHILEKYYDKFTRQYSDLFNIFSNIDSLLKNIDPIKNNSGFLHITSIIDASKLMRSIHSHLNKITQCITDLCQSPEIKENTELFINLCKLYEELECFLPEEKRIDISDYLKDIKVEKQTVSIQRTAIDSMTHIIKEVAKAETTETDQGLIDKALIEKCKTLITLFPPQDIAETSINDPESQVTIHSQKSEEETSHTTATSSMDTHP